jgi:hypothetical protein
VVNQIVSGIVNGALSDQTETLAWRSAKDNVDVGLAYLRVISNVPRIDVRYATANDGAAREVELVRSAVNRVVLNCRQYLETRLLETEAHPACPGEKVDANQFSAAHHPLSYRSSLHPARRRGGVNTQS